MTASTISCRVLLCVLFCLCGFLGNWFKAPLYFNVDFLFGSVFSMLAILVCGRTCGIIAALVAGTCTYLLWNHPWAIIVFTGEAIFVSWLYAKHKGNLVLYDLIYWSCFGIPIAIVLYHSVMGLTILSSFVILLKQSINGLFNTLLAVLVLVLFKFVKKPAGLRVSCSELLFTVMIAFALLPTMLLSISAIRTYEKSAMDTFQSKVSSTTQIAQKNLAGWINEYHNQVQILARFVGDPNTTTSLKEMQRYVETIREANPALKGMGVFDNRSISISYSPLKQDGKSNLGRDMSFRPHIATLREGKKPYITDMLISKLGAPNPIVILLAPIVLSGEYRGYCSGVVEISNLANFLTNLKTQDIQITLVDGQNKVIVSTSPDIQTNASFTRPYLHPRQKTSVYQPCLWQPEPKPNAGLMTRWRHSFLFSSIPVSANCQWRLIVEAPLLPVAENISCYSLTWLGLQALLISAAIVLSSLLSHGFIANVRKLQLLTRSIQERLDDSPRIEWPNSAIEELDDLANNFQHMTSALVNQIAEQRSSENALRESEEHLKAMFAMASVGVAQADPKTGRWVRANQKMSEITGYSNDELLEMRISEVTHPEDRDRDWQAFQSVVDNRAKNYRMEKRYIRKNGEIAWVNVNMTVLRDAAGHPLRTVAMIEDISERKRMEEEKAQVEQQLRQAQKMEAIGHLAGGIAHDFNNILGAILGFAEMAKKECEPEGKVSKNLLRVLEAANRAAGLVKQILAFSRQANAAPIMLNPKHIVKEAVTLLRPLLPATITIRQQYDEKLLNIVADPTQIHQIMMNLCTNAFHAMEQTGGILDIRLENQELSSQTLFEHPTIKPGKFVVLSIGDTGSGVPREIRDKIFNPFFTTKKIGKGTGMGLAIIHGITASLGGFVAFESSPEQGTIFRIFIPAVATEAPLENTAPDSALTGNEHVLFVDDEMMLAELGKTMLEHLGYRVTVCTESMTAWSLFHEDPDKFAVLVTDQTMPNMTGVELAAKILQINPGFPILLCTGYSSLINEEQAYRYGIKGFVEKPFSQKELAAALRKVLDQDISIQ